MLYVDRGPRQAGGVVTSESTGSLPGAAFLADVPPDGLALMGPPLGLARVQDGLTLTVEPDDRPLAFVWLTVLLLATGVEVHELNECLGEDSALEWFVRADGASQLTAGDVDDEVRLQALVRVVPRASNPWKPLLGRFGLPLTSSTDATSESAALIARVGTIGAARHVIFCFGGLSRSIPARLTDPRFGLIVALNKHCAGAAVLPWRQSLVGPRRRTHGDADPSHAVRSVNAEARSGYRHRLNAVAAGPTPVAGLRLDTEVDLLKGLRVRTEDELMRDLHGGQSLRFDTPIENLDQIEQLADHLVSLRNRTDYLREWEWVDHIVPVEEGPEFDGALSEYLGRVMADDAPETELVLPPLRANGSGRIQVSYPRERTQQGRIYPRWSDFSRWLRHSQDHDPESIVLRGQFRCSLEGQPELVDRIPVLQCLVSEFRFGGHDYILSDGTLFRVDGTYIDAMDKALARIERCPFPFPPYGGGTEGAYNDAAPKGSDHRLAMLDRTSIVLPGQTSIEPCDLVTDDGTLVFVKPKGSSSSFSHLSTQAIAAAALFRNEGKARDALLDRVIQATASFPSSDIADAIQERLIRLENGEPRSMTACLLILGRWGLVPSPGSLPLLSRISLRRTVRELENLSYRVQLAMPGEQLTAPPK